MKLHPFQTDTPPAQSLSAEYREAHADVPAPPPSGGDFHSAFALEDGSGKVAVVIGDIAGHGPEQAAQAVLMRELLANCLAAGLSPAETLDAVSDGNSPPPAAPCPAAVICPAGHRDLRRVVAPVSPKMSIG